MNLFQNTSDPKQLSISEMWNLYRTLRDGLAGSTQTFLIDEIEQIMDGIDTESFKSALRQMYGEKINYLEKTPIDLCLMFVRGIKETNLLGFTDFIKAVARGN